MPKNGAIIKTVARGWESKAVEGQMEASAVVAPAQDSKDTKFTPEMQALQRKRQGIQLARKRVLQQLEVSSNERYTQMLNATLAELDSELSKLN